MIKMKNPITAVIMAALILLAVFASPSIASTPPQIPTGPSDVAVSGNAGLATEKTTYGFTLTGTAPVDPTVDQIIPVTVTAVYHRTTGGDAAPIVLDASITIPAGQSTGASSPGFQIPDDGIRGSAGTMTVTMTTSADGVRMAVPFTVTINDGTDMPVFTVTGLGTVYESTSAIYTVSMSPVSASTITATVSKTDASTSTLSTSTLVFAPGESSKTFVLNVPHDGVLTAARNIVLDVSATGVTSGSKTVAVTETETSHTMTFKQGWNLMSFSVVPTNWNTLWTDLATNPTNTVSVYQYFNGNGYKYFTPNPDYAQGALTKDNFANGLGFWVYAAQQYSVTVVYDPSAKMPITTPTKINGDRWNLVACPLWVPTWTTGVLPYDLVDNGVTSSSDCDAVYDYGVENPNGFAYYSENPNYAPGAMTTLYGWQGYWVLMK